MAWVYTNVPAPGGVVDDNYGKFNVENGIAGRTIIVKVAKTNLTNDELKTIVAAITSAGGAGADAFTVAGLGTADGSAFVSGTTDVVFLALQGTGTYTADSSDAHGVSGAVTTIEAVFVNAA